MKLTAEQEAPAKALFIVMGKQLRGHSGFPLNK